MLRQHNPTMPKMEKHEEQLEEMHSALYQLGDKARSKSGSKLLPTEMTEGAAEARTHIAKLHRAMRGEKKS